MVILPAAQAGLLNSNIKYSVSWNRTATNADRAERLSLLTALAEPSWLDPATGGPRR